MNNLIIANNNYFFTLPSILLGIILAIIPTRLTLKFLLKNNYDEYISYNKLMHKFSFNKYIKYFKFFVILASLLLTILGYNWYVYYNDSTLKINNFLNIKSTNISYKDIHKIYLIRNNIKSNGDYIYQKHYLIELKNGKEIDLQKTLLDNKNFENKILPLINNKIKLNIQTIESLDDKN
jgi:hypothetical protein